jgi:hypothetical protein
MMVCLAITAHAHSRGTRSVVITPQDILRHKAISSQGRELVDLEQRVAQAMETLRVLQFDFSKSRPGDSARKYQVGLRRDHLLIIAKYTETEGDLSSGQYHEYTRAWTVMLGQWANHFLNRGGVYWVSNLAQATLQLGHRRNRPGDSLAKKIMYLLFVVPASIRHIEAPCEMTITSLLQRIGELPVPENRDRNWGTSTREALQDALNVLEETGLVASVEWPDGFGPADTPRVKGWVSRWLAARIRITGLEAYKTMLEAREKGLTAPPVRSEPKLSAPKPEAGKNAALVVDASAIWQKLDRLHWQQRTLAKHLGYSQTYLSYVMSGRRKASKEMARALQHFLDTSDEKLRGD